MKMNVKTLAATALLSVSGIALASPAYAIDGLAANVAFSTDYVWRGVTQSSHNPALSGGLDYTIGDSGFAVGTWVSMIDFGDAPYAGGSDSPMEWDVYGSYTTAITDKLSGTVGVYGYLYPSQSKAYGGEYDFYEVWGGLSYDLGFATLGGQIWYSPDVFGTSTESSVYYTATLGVPITDWLSASGSYGHYDFETSPIDYNTWTLGLAATYEAYTLGFTYSDTDKHSFGTLFKDAYILSLTYRM